MLWSFYPLSLCLSMSVSTQYIRVPVAEEALGRANRLCDHVLTGASPCAAQHLAAAQTLYSTTVPQYHVRRDSRDIRDKPSPSLSRGPTVLIRRSASRIRPGHVQWSCWATTAFWGKRHGHVFNGHVLASNLQPVHRDMKYWTARTGRGRCPKRTLAWTMWVHRPLFAVRGTNGQRAGSRKQEGGRWTRAISKTSN